MIKVMLMMVLTSISTIIFANVKLGNPIKMNFLNEYYGEEETATQEGKYSNIYANYEERYILYDLNLYRMAPQILLNEDSNTSPDVKKCINWGYCFQPTKPLYWNLNLSRASRYHSNDMIVNNCFAHNDCDGGDIWNRIQRYYTSNAMGENIAAGSTYSIVTKNFINEKGAAPGTVGHRENVFSPSFNEVGLGYLKGGSYRTYTTQDFGASAKPHVIPVAIHEVKSPNKGSEVKFKAIYHNKNKNPEIYLVLNGKQIKMNKDLSSEDWESNNYVGKAPLRSIDWYSAEYTVTAKIEADCNYYNILAKSDGQEYHYPDKGFLLLGTNCNNKIYSENALNNGIHHDNSKINNSSSDEGCNFGTTNNNYIFFFIILLLGIFFRKRFI